MFRGNHPARVDDKGRLKLPSEFKRRVDEVYGPQFYITSKDGKRAEIYPIREWEKVEQKLATISNSNLHKQKYLDATNYYGQMAEMDAQGRLLLPQILRESARTITEVVVLGSQTYLEVVNHDAFKTRLDGDPLNADDLKALADLGI